MQKYPNDEEIWVKEAWLKQARDIITNLDQFPLSTKIILLLRHSNS